MKYTWHYPSPLGDITLASDGAAITGLWFDGQKRFGRGLADGHTETHLPVFDEAARWLDAYFGGAAPDFTPPLHLSATPFESAVWQLLLKIPYGETVTYGLYAAQERGRLFIGPGVQVYEGMIVGECAKNEDIVCNVCKKKQMTNTRAAGSDEALRLTPHSVLSLEQCMEFLSDDELLEVTPQSLRLRKIILSKEQRMKQQFRKS